MLYIVLQLILVIVVCSAQNREFLYINIKLHTLLDLRITGSKSLNLGIRQRSIVNIITGARRRFAGYDLRDKLLLVLDRLPVVAVECTLSNITIDMYLFVCIALTENTTVTLLYITRTPWAIDMMQRNKAFLHIEASAHLGSRANQHADCTRFHFAAECVLFCGSVRIVNICDLVSWYTLGDQLIPNIVIRTETTAVLACRRGCCKVAEDKLCAFGRLAAFPCIEHIFHDHIELAARIVQQGRVSQPLIERELASVIGDSEHIVLVGCDCTAAHAVSAFAEFLHHGLLCRCRLCLYIVVFHFRPRQGQSICGLDVRSLSPEIDKLRQITKFRKTGLCAITCTLWGQLHRCDRFTEVGRPTVKVGHIDTFQRIVLKIAHHRVQLGHGVGNRRAGRKAYAMIISFLVQIFALSEHIFTFLRCACVDTADIAHFCKQSEVLKFVRFIDKQSVNTEFFKGDNIVFFLCIHQLFQTGFQLLFRGLQPPYSEV